MHVMQPVVAAAFLLGFAGVAMANENAVDHVNQGIHSCNQGLLDLWHDRCATWCDRWRTFPRILTKPAGG